MKRTLLALALMIPASASAQHRHHRRHHRHRDEAATPAPTAAPAPAPAPAPVPVPSEATAPPPAPVPSEATAPPTAPPPAPAPLASLPPPAWAERPPARASFEFGPVFGLGVSTAGLGLGPNLGVEIGGRVTAGSGSFAFAVRGSWSAYTTNGSGVTACTPMGTGGSNDRPAPNAPCVSQPPTGTYDWSLAETVVSVALPLSFRFLPHARAFNAFVGVAPTLAWQRAETTAFGLRTVESAMRVGVQGLAGVQYRLGPGSAFFEVGYAWSPVGHRATGSVDLGSVQLALGYRLSFPSR